MVIVAVSGDHSGVKRVSGNRRLQQIGSRLGVPSGRSVGRLREVSGIALKVSVSSGLRAVGCSELRMSSSRGLRVTSDGRLSIVCSGGLRVAVIRLDVASGWFRAAGDRAEGTLGGTASRDVVASDSLGVAGGRFDMDRVSLEMDRERLEMDRSRLRVDSGRLGVTRGTLRLASCGIIK